MGRLRARTIGLAGVLLFMGALAVPPESPVADAAERGDLEAVRALVHNGADVNAAQADGMTALHWAALNRDARMASILLYAGAHPQATTRLGAYTAVHLAAQRGFADVLRTLLDAGADPTALTETGVSPLHLAAESGDEETVELLLDRGASVDVRDTHSDRTPLMFATALGRLGVMRALLDAGADPSLDTRVVDYTELSKEDAVERRRRQRVMAAIRGEGPPAQSEGRQAAAPATPRVGGERSGRPDSIGGSLAERREPANVDPDQPSTIVLPQLQAKQDGRPSKPEPQPLGYSDLVGRQGGMTALHYAARDGRIDEAVMLVEAGADVNAVTGGDHSTPLLVSVINGNYDLAMELLARGADPNILSEDGAGPLFATVNSRWAHRTWYPQPTAWQQQRTTHLDLMKALLDAGAAVNQRLQTHIWYAVYNAGRIGVDYAGATAFWRAAYSLDVDAMKLLVAYGADPDIPTIKPAERRRGGDPDDDSEGEDPSGLPPVEVGGPAVYPIHAASGVGYGTSRVGQQHNHVPDGWMNAVRYLVEELGADVNIRDHDGYSAMHNAAARGDNEMIRFLAAHGADATLVSRRGQTTADMANGPQQRVQPFPETIALLESLGAKNNHKCMSC
jgi:ankyrin repeat protein